MLSLSCLRVLLISLAVTTSEAVPACRRRDNNSAVDLGYAIYQGAVDPTTHVRSFKGIRYAAPPVGESHRFERDHRRTIDFWIH
jgi:acetylcholinesterase